MGIAMVLTGESHFALSAILMPGALVAEATFANLTPRIAALKSRPFSPCDSEGTSSSPEVSCARSEDT